MIIVRGPRGNWVVVGRDGWMKISGKFLLTKEDFYRATSADILLLVVEDEIDRQKNNFQPKNTSPKCANDPSYNAPTAHQSTARP